MAILEIISGTAKFEKLTEGSALKREASLQCFLRKLKQRNVFNENEYYKLYPSGSAPARIYDTPKMQKFSSCDSYSKLHPIVSSIGTFNYNLSRFLCNLLSPLGSKDYLTKTLFLLFLKLRMQIFPENFLFPMVLLVFLLILHFKKPLI